MFWSGKYTIPAVSEYNTPFLPFGYPGKLQAGRTALRILRFLSGRQYPDEETLPRKLSLHYRDIDH